VLALGLRLWIPGLATWVILHSAAVFLARIDPEFLPSRLRAARHREHLAC
jgi:type IV secretion system protein TrbD